MLTKNYWIYRAASDASNTDALFGDLNIHTKLKTTNGSAPTKTSAYSSETWSNSSRYFPDLSSIGIVSQIDVLSKNGTSDSKPILMSSGCGIVFGSGNSAPTIDDYKLSGYVVTGFTVSSSSIKESAEDGSMATWGRSYTITNNGETDITIGEIGYFVESRLRTAGNTYKHYFIMTERTALESPITIPAGGVGQITYTIKMNYPVG